MLNKKEDKNRILEVIVIKGITYLRNAINSKLVAAHLALKGSKVNILSARVLTVKVIPGFYI